MKTISIVLLSFALMTQARASEPAYFLAGPMVSYNIHQESFVVPITNAQQIAQAMQELEKPLTNRWAVECRVAAGHDYINRDYLNDKKSWNWHVVQFERFSQAGLVIYNYYPSYVEKDPENYVTRRNGKIVFTAYPLIRRLSQEEMFFSTAQISSNGIALRWLDLGTNYSYTVESRNLAATNWSAVQNMQWPIMATNILITNTGLTQFYRVLAHPRN